MEKDHDERPPSPLSAVHVEERGTGANSAIFLHGVLSWGTDERYGFGNQLPLADEFRLRLVDRRGYGDSPDTEGDFTSD